MNNKEFNCFQKLSRSLIVTTLTVWLAAGCATSGGALLDIETLREPKSLQGSQVALGDGEDPAVDNVAKVMSGPDSDHRPGVADQSLQLDDQELPDGKFQGSFNNMRLSAFINEVFGNQLALSFTIDPKVQAMDELVTLRLTDEVDANRLFTIAKETLANYGVNIINEDGLYVFGTSQKKSGGELPLVVSGRALPDVPASHRPLFVFVPVDVVNGNALVGWLRQALRGQDVKLSVVPEINALLVQGKQADIDQVLSMIDILDQPAMRGNFSSVVEPVYAEAGRLAKDVVEILKSQGYEASMRPPVGSVFLLPMSSSNKIVVLAASKEVLEQAIEWTLLLDKQTTSGIENGIFIYQVRNTDVEYVVSLLNQLALTETVSPDTDNKDVRSGTSLEQGKFIPDVNRNAVLFRGSGREWVEVLPSIIEMDQPTPSVLVEVILAEVTLNDSDESGIEFIARSGDVTYSTLGGIGLSGNGLTATLNRAGETRAVLNAFYRSERANIRSRPRLMVKSGQIAQIDVGNEIPFVTSTAQSTENVGSPIVQTVNYRKTGVILQIEPIVHSSGYVDIRISQELSEAQQTSTSSIDSPTIFNRSLETTVTLRDGGSVLLGGLISETSADSNNGIKGLGKLPGVGKLFRNDAVSRDKTELVMMVIPYIIENPDEAAEITDRALEILELTR